MKFAAWIVAFTAVVAAAPASAQNLSDKEQFLEAVAERDGNTATALVRSNGKRVLDTRNGDGETPLLITISRRDTQWTGFLLSEGADPNYSSADGELPLIVAARIGFGQALEWLLTKGAEVDGTNRMGETALIVAVQQRRGDIVEKLLQAGANPDIADSAAGYSARDYAKRDSRSNRMLELIEAAENKPEKVTDIDDFKLK